MASFQSVLKEHNLDPLSRGKLETLQVNLGRRCNMTCEHCHVNAGPAAEEVMSDETADSIIRFLFKHRMQSLDITGGAPEMAPVFNNLVSRAADLVNEIIVRCNLTVLFEEGMEYLPKFYKGNKIHLVCSLPCYTEKNVDKQRGAGTFKKSIRALQLLNEEGYGNDSDLKLDLVYNPGGAFLPSSQSQLEADYKRELGNNYNIKFNHLITITNMPISRFEGVVKGTSSQQAYLKLLMDNFNPSAVASVMCRNLLSVAWDGKIYDCDFNQALGIEATDETGQPLTIGNINPGLLEGKDIICADHCFACVAGEGSSCSGALVKT